MGEIVDLAAGEGDERRVVGGGIRGDRHEQDGQIVRHGGRKQTGSWWEFQSLVTRNVLSVRAVTSSARSLVFVVPPLQGPLHGP